MGEVVVTELGVYAGGSFWPYKYFRFTAHSVAAAAYNICLID